MKIYHMIIAHDWEEAHGDTSTRKEYLSTTQGKTPEGWICVGVCGYHEAPKICQYSVDDDCQLCPDRNHCNGTKAEQRECAYV